MDIVSSNLKDMIVSIPANTINATLKDTIIATPIGTLIDTFIVDHEEESTTSPMGAHTNTLVETIF